MQKTVRSLSEAGFEVRDERVPPVRGAFAPAALMIHWTASTRGDLPALNTVKYGRTGLSGPLYSFLVGRAGTIAWVSEGRANHAGNGNTEQLEQAWQGKIGPDTDVFRGPDTHGGGNSSTIGIGLENSGSEPIPEVQFEAATRLAAGLLAEYNLSAGHMLMHSQYTRRKIDLRPEQWAPFHKQVAGLMELEAKIPAGPHGYTLPEYEPPLHVDDRVVSSCESPAGAWVLTQNGYVYAFGGARYYGSVKDDARRFPEHPNHILYDVLGTPVRIIPVGVGYRIVTDLGYYYDFGPESI